MFETIAVQFAALTGFAALIAVIVNILKFFNIVKEDEAKLWVMGLNVLGILVMYGFRIFYPAYDFATLDPLMLEIATVSSFILAFLVQIGMSTLTHLLIRGTPVIGTSFSYTRERMVRLGK